MASIVADLDMIDLSQDPTSSMCYSSECNFDYFEVDLYVQSSARVPRYFIKILFC